MVTNSNRGNAGSRVSKQKAFIRDADSELVVEFARDADGLTAEEELRVVEHLLQRQAAVRVDVGEFDERERLALRVR